MLLFNNCPNITDRDRVLPRSHGIYGLRKLARSLCFRKTVLGEACSRRTGYPFFGSGVCLTVWGKMVVDGILCYLGSEDDVMIYALATLNWPWLITFTISSNSPGIASNLPTTETCPHVQDKPPCPANAPLAHLVLCQIAVHLSPQTPPGQLPQHC